MKNVIHIVIALALCVLSGLMYGWAKGRGPIAPIGEVATSSENSGEVSEHDECLHEADALMANMGKSTNAGENDEPTFPGGAIPDGRYGFGFVRKVSKNTQGDVVLTIDPALWFTDGPVTQDDGVQNADMAAREDSHMIDADAPNGFYIRNQNHQIRDYILPANAEVVVTTIYTPEKTGTYLCEQGINNELVNSQAKLVTAAAYYARADKQLREFPDSLLPVAYDIESGVIMRMSEQYVP